MTPWLWFLLGFMTGFAVELVSLIVLLRHLWSKETSDGMGKAE